MKQPYRAQKENRFWQRMLIAGLLGLSLILCIVVGVFVKTDLAARANDEQRQSGDKMSAPGGPAAMQAGAADEEAAAGVYHLELTRFGIRNDKTAARETTEGINAALRHAVAQGYQKVVFPDGDYLIYGVMDNRHAAGKNGIQVPSHLEIDLNQACLYLEKNSSPAYACFVIDRQENVSIRGGYLIGDKAEHDYDQAVDDKSHEFGYGVCISASANVTIADMNISGMTGDAVILIGYELIADGYPNNENVKILNNELYDCRRQGISVVNALNCEIANNIIHDIAGTAPQFGITIEMENDYDAKGTQVHHNTIFSCAGGGISAHSGSDYEIYENTVVDGDIIAVESRNVRIYDNNLVNATVEIQDVANNSQVLEYGNKLK